MSRFSGMNNHHNQTGNRFAYNPFHQEVIFQRQNHWDFLRNNIDDIIKNSKVLQENEHKIVEQEENSRCNEIEIIYECIDEPKPVNTNPIADDVAVAEITAPLPVVVEGAPAVDTPVKKRMDFASVVFKYRNQLASRKHKELQSSV